MGDSGKRARHAAARDPLIFPLSEVAPIHRHLDPHQEAHLRTAQEHCDVVNTLRTRHIERADPIDGIGYARSGYAEIIKHQTAGWHYLRP
jgi:hypothetical protein